MKQFCLGDGVEAFGGWSKEGHLNAVLYPPGVVCEAIGGCPVNQNCYSVVTWYPGKETVMRCFGTEVEAKKWINKTLRFDEKEYCNA